MEATFPDGTKLLTVHQPICARPKHVSCRSAVEKRKQSCSNLALFGIFGLFDGFSEDLTWRFGSTASLRQHGWRFEPGFKGHGNLEFWMGRRDKNSYFEGSNWRWSTKKLIIREGFTEPFIFHVTPQIQLNKIALRLLPTRAWLWSFRWDWGRRGKSGFPALGCFRKLYVAGAWKGDSSRGDGMWFPLQTLISLFRLSSVSSDSHQSLQTLQTSLDFVLSLTWGFCSFWNTLDSMRICAGWCWVECRPLLGGVGGDEYWRPTHPG